MNLGEQMKANTKRMAEMTEAQASREKLEREALENAQLRINLGKVREYFDFVKKVVSADILAGLPPRKVAMDQRGGQFQLGDILQTYRWSGSQGVSIKDRHHPYYGIWAEFDDWARQNGLQGKLCYDYDTGGRDSWNLVTVEPLK